MTICLDNSGKMVPASSQAIILSTQTLSSDWVCLVALNQGHLLKCLCFLHNFVLSSFSRVPRPVTSVLVVTLNASLLWERCHVQWDVSAAGNGTREICWPNKPHAPVQGHIAELTLLCAAQQGFCSASISFLLLIHYCPFTYLCVFLQSLTLSMPIWWNLRLSMRVGWQ